jgi:hypothetical protein
VAHQTRDTPAAFRRFPTTESHHPAGNHNENRTSLLPTPVADRIADKTFESFLTNGKSYDALDNTLLPALTEKHFKRGDRAAMIIARLDEGLNQ